MAKFVFDGCYENCRINRFLKPTTNNIYIRHTIHFYLAKCLNKNVVKNHEIQYIDISTKIGNTDKQSEIRLQ